MGRLKKREGICCKAFRKPYLSVSDKDQWIANYGIADDGTACHGIVDYVFADH